MAGWGEGPAGRYSSPPPPPCTSSTNTTVMTIFILIRCPFSFVRFFIVSTVYVIWCLSPPCTVMWHITISTTSEYQLSHGVRRVLAGCTCRIAKSFRLYIRNPWWSVSNTLMFELVAWQPVTGFLSRWLGGSRRVCERDFDPSALVPPPTIKPLYTRLSPRLLDLDYTLTSL